MVAVAQVASQLIPAGFDVTVPGALPRVVLVSTIRTVLMVNVAVTVVAEDSVTVQEVVVPVQPPPDQPPNVELASAVAVSVTMGGPPDVA